MNLMSILPKGYGTYIVAGVGIVGIWALYGLQTMGVIGTDTVATAFAACQANIDMTDPTQAAVVEACKTAAQGPLTWVTGLTVTVGLVAAAFLRRGITNAAVLLPALLGGSLMLSSCGAYERMCEDKLGGTYSDAGRGSCDKGLQDLF